MTPEQLGRELAQMYEEAPKGHTVAKIHLFGIKYSNEIDGCAGSITDIVVSSGIPVSYVTEVNKGKNLARYVTAK